MKKNLTLLLILLGLCFSVQFLRAASPVISGGTKDINANIIARLEDIRDHTSLKTKSNRYLQQQVLLAIEPYGYFQSSVRLHRAANGEIESIRIQLGRPVKITSFELEIIGEGAKEPDILSAKQAISIHSGQIFNSLEYEAAKQSLFNAAEHQGYLRGSFTTATVLIDRQKYQAKITLVFNTGQQFYFGQARFDPTNISQSLLQRYVPFQYGQVYETEKVLELSNHLSGSGYFKQVVVKPDISDQRFIPVNIHLQATSRINYTLGAGYGTDTGVRGKAGMHVVPVNKKGHKFSLVAQGSRLQNTVQAQYVIPGKDPVKEQYDISGNAGTQNFNSGYSKYILASAATRYNTAEYQRALSLNLLHENYRYTNDSRREASTLFPRAALSFRRTTDPMFTPTGFSINLNSMAASEKMLSDITFVQGSVDLRAALSLSPIRTRFYLHATQGYNTITDIYSMPLSLVFLMGGPDNLKAYSINSIGPGKILNYVGFEIQKETKDKWYLIGFVDAGDVYNPVPRQFKYDAGVGIMWVSPVGPIKIGVAQAINRRGQRIRGRSPQLTINLGPDI